MMTMKKLFKSLFVVIAATATFAGCQKEENNAPATETKTVEFFANALDTKTQFTDPVVSGSSNQYPTIWTGNEGGVQVLINLVDESSSDGVTVSNDSKSASFKVDFKNVTSTAPYTFYAMSPKSAYLGKNDERYSATIPTTQIPLTNSVDEAAQILYAVSDEYTEIPDVVNFNFHHFTAYGKLSFVNLNLNGATINSIDITSSVNFAGRWNYFVETETFGENSGSSTITVKTSATENIWFACAPVDMDGQTLTFTVNTDNGPLSKTVTLTNRKFEAGKVAVMTVDMTGVEFAESKVYELVTDAAELTTGSKIIIVAKSSDLALGTTQNNNNRAASAITRSDDKLTISDPSNSVQVITVQDGKKEGTVAFDVTGGYLCAANSSSNYLRTEATLSDNSSWSITIAGPEATIIAQGSYTRNYIRYNPNNGNPIFSCYAAGSATGEAVSIYKLQGSGSAPLPILAAPTVTAELNDDNTGINISWTAVENATSYVVSCTGQDDVTVSSSTEYAFEELSSGTYEITVTAKADGYRSAKSESKSVTVPAASTGGEGGKEVTITFKLDKTTTGSSSSSYVNVATTFMSEGVSYTVANWNPSTLQIRGNKSPSNNDLQKAEGDRNFMLRNTTAIPGTIKSIRIECTAGTIVAGKTYAIVGASQITSQTANASQAAIAETNAVSWTFANGGSYFAIGMVNGGTSGTTKAGTITIVYQAN